jgi:hypothetical protein
MYPKNAASPEKIAIGAVVQISDGAVQTSGCTVRILTSGDAEGDGGGTTAYSTDGVVLYTPTQAESNHASFILIAKKTGCIPASITVVPTLSATPGEAVCASTQKVDVETIKTNPVVNAGTITFPTGKTLASTDNITAGTITTVTTVTNQLTAAAIATGVWQDTTDGDFTTADSIGQNLKAADGAVPGAAGGLFIVGANIGNVSIAPTTGNALTLTGGTTNSAGLKVTGLGSGSAVDLTGGATGNGMLATGGSGTGGAGIKATGGGYGYGLSCTGTGASAGLYSVGAGGQPGISVLGQGAGAGLACAGGATGVGLLSTGGTTLGATAAVITGSGAGISGITGVTLAATQTGVTIPTVTTVTNAPTDMATATNQTTILAAVDTIKTDAVEILTRLPDATPGAADGLMILGANTGDTTFTPTSNATPAIKLTGKTSGAGLKVIGGVDGPGLEATGGATSGMGIQAVATGSGCGLYAEGADIYPGVFATGGSSGAGIQAVGGGNAVDAAGMLLQRGGVLSDDLKLTNSDAPTLGIEAIDTIVDALTTEMAKIPKSDSTVSWNNTALAAINAEVDTALNTAIPGSPTSNSINERIATMDATVAKVESLMEIVP